MFGSCQGAGGREAGELWQTLVSCGQAKAPLGTHWCTATNERGPRPWGHLTPVRRASSLHLQEHDQPILLEEGWAPYTEPQVSWDIG